MHLIFLLARVYPYWALAIAIVMAQLGVFFKRRKSALRFQCFAVSGALLVGILLWFVFRGDLHSDEWMRAITGG